MLTNSNVNSYTDVSNQNTFHKDVVHFIKGIMDAYILKYKMHESYNFHKLHFDHVFTSSGCHGQQIINLI